MLQLGEAALDMVSKGVDVSVDDPLNFSVPFRWDHGDDVTVLEVGQDRVGVIALVAEHDVRLWSWLGHDWPEALLVRHLASSQDYAYRKSQAVYSQMYLCREAASRAAKTFIITFFLRQPHVDGLE